ncbi:MAG TPA: serine hydrolase domain-containing protein [Kofleriaceae bacterium]|nr:serine hydrolase domain-containing protein [Kofleriaceae bacterium]
MNQRMLQAVAVTLTVAVGASGCTSTKPKAAMSPAQIALTPRKAAIAEQVQPFLDSKILDSVVVGISVNGKTEVYGFGRGTAATPAIAPDGDSLFEIGSITKVYTGMLLADAVEHGQATLDAPFSDFVPPGVTVPAREKKVITLGHLLTHTSGLPRLPASIDVESPNPYGAYNEDMLYRDLSATKLERAPGENEEYSNFGAGLLGFAVGKKLGGGFASELKQRVLAPLQLTATTLTPTAAEKARVVTGVNDDLVAVPGWTFDALAPAGGLLSTANDQLRMLDAQLAAHRNAQTPVAATLRRSQALVLDTAESKVAYGWMVDKTGRYWHNGGTGGYHSFVGFDPQKNIAVVVLAATASSLVDRLAIAAFQIAAGDPAPPVKFPTAAELAPLVGDFDVAELSTKVTVTTTNGRLYIGAPGEAPARLIPLTAREFLIEALQTVVVFEEKSGKIEQLVFVINGKPFVAKRVP